MEPEIIPALLAELKKLAAPDCRFCAYNTVTGVDACEEIEYDCDSCPRPCPCRNCNEANNHAGWEWHGFARRTIMDDIKKDPKELFQSAIARLKRSGVDTTCYKDVVVALETEIRHYRDVIGGMENHLRNQKNNGTVYSDGFQAGILKGVRLFAARLIFTILENAAEGESLGVDQMVSMILYSCMDHDYFTEDRDG